jgi:uncharacterized coiled-coil protein SlyX
MQPTLENRVETLEVRVSKNEASILQLSKDIKQLGHDIGVHFDRNTDAIMQEVHKIEAKLETRFERLEATMATKDDILALKATQTEQGAKLDQLLELLKRS